MPKKLSDDKASPKKRAKPKISEVDVLIVGAGIVGQTLALALAKQKLEVSSDAAITGELSIVVLDAQDGLTLEPSAPDVFSARVSAISKASQRVYEELGVWERVARMQQYTYMKVWEKDAFAEIDFAAKDTGEENLGHIVENTQLTESLRVACSKYENIHYALGHAIKTIRHCDAGYHLTLSNGDILSTKLLVGADGANSFVRAQMGFAQTYWDYEHDAIVANVRTEKPHAQTAYQAFSASGPLAFLPLPDSHQCSIVWSQETDHANYLLNTDDSEFCKALAVGLDMRLGTCELTTARASFPLRMRYARQWVDECVVLVGDAAHTIHPLAGQGANLGIADAIALVENIKGSIERDKAFYSKAELRRYERFRKAEAQKIIATMEGLKQIFAGDNPAKKLIRNIGLSAANRFTMVKQFFVEQASG